MGFKVNAVPAAQFAQWVTAARNSGPALDATSYADLAKPSRALAPFTYRSVASGLFQQILSSPLPTSLPSAQRDLTLQRAEQ
jgi:cytochrome o ubiquinol oxidase subunit 2